MTDFLKPAEKPATQYALVDAFNNVVSVNTCTPEHPKIPSDDEVRPGIRVLPVQEANPPPFDAATQWRAPPVYTVGGYYVIKTVSVRDKTTEELIADLTRLQDEERRVRAALAGQRQ